MHKPKRHLRYSTIRLSSKHQYLRWPSTRQHSLHSTPQLEHHATKRSKNEHIRNTTTYLQMFFSSRTWGTLDIWYHEKPPLFISTCGLRVKIFLLQHRCWCHTQQGCHPPRMAWHLNQTVARITHTWGRKQHCNIWHQQYQWINHPEVFFPQHFQVWHNIPIHQILSCNHGPSIYLHLVQSNRWWILLRLSWTHTKKIAPTHLLHNRNLRWSTWTNNSKAQGPPRHSQSMTQIITWHLCHKPPPMTKPTMFTWPSHTWPEKSTVTKPEDSQSHRTEENYMR